MTTTTLARRGRGMVATAVLLLAAVPAAADFKQDYLKGVEALGRGNLAEAARLLRTAMREEPLENARVKFYGVRFEPYLVHYQLGETLARLGECEEAVARFDESERQGVIQGVGDLYGRLKATRDQCRASLRPPTPAVATPPPARPTATPAPAVDPRLFRQAQVKAQNAVSEATRAADAVKNRLRRPEYREVSSQRPDLGQRLDAASAKLERARNLMAQGDREQRVADLDDAAALAAEARRELDAVQQTADTARTQLAQSSDREREARRQQLLGEVSALLAPAQQVFGQAQALPPSSRERLARERRTLELVVAQARSVDSLSVMQLEALKEQLTIATRDLREATERGLQEPVATPTAARPGLTPPPADRPETPPTLRTAVGAYLRADYRATVEALERADFPQPRAAAVASLFRGAARYLLYLEGGSRNRELKELATSDVRLSRQKDPEVLPLPEVFSPVFVEFFNSVR